MLPERIQQYRVVGKLGEGGMGEVYLAQDETLSRQVAIKLLNSRWSRDPRAVERFHREARITAALNHPHICTIYEFGDLGGRPYMIMELLDGQTLRDMIDGWPLPLDLMLDIAIQVTDALEVAHEGGIVHRDIKSSNIFITKHGTAKVLDFGLAKLEGKDPLGPGTTLDLPGAGPPCCSLSSPGLAFGTVTNMSPEQVEGRDLDSRSDLFSFGIVLYEMATGELPFQGIDYSMIMHAILSGPHRLPSKINPTLPPEIDRILGKILEKDRALRYQTPADLKIDLVKLRAGTRLDTRA